MTSNTLSLGSKASSSERPGAEALMWTSETWVPPALKETTRVPASVATMQPSVVVTTPLGPESSGPPGLAPAKGGVAVRNFVNLPVAASTTSTAWFERSER